MTQDCSFHAPCLTCARFSCIQTSRAVAATSIFGVLNYAAKPAALCFNARYSLYKPKSRCFFDCALCMQAMCSRAFLLWLQLPSTVTVRVSFRMCHPLSLRLLLSCTKGFYT